MSDEPEATAPAVEVVPWSELEAVLLNPRLKVEDDPEAARRAIMQRILDAETPEDVLRDDEVIHAREMIGEPFIAVNVRFLNSDFEDGPGVYAIIEAASDDGEALLISCGAMKVIGKLYRLATMGAFPRRVKIIEAGKPTPAGYRPLNLVDAANDPKRSEPF